MGAISPMSTTEFIFLGTRGMKKKSKFVGGPKLLSIDLSRNPKQNCISLGIFMKRVV